MFRFSLSHFRKCWNFDKMWPEDFKTLDFFLQVFLNIREIGNLASGTAFLNFRRKN